MVIESGARTRVTKSIPFGLGGKSCTDPHSYTTPCVPPSKTDSEGMAVAIEL